MLASDNALIPRLANQAVRVVMSVAGVLLVLIFLFIPTGTVSATTSSAGKDGRQIVKQMLKATSQQPFVYEEQSMILIDKSNNRDVRDIRRYLRVDSSNKARVLLVFDAPEEIKGVALLVVVNSDRQQQGGIYLPAFEKRLLTADSQGGADRFLGSDFSVFDLQPENMNDFIYTRLDDVQINEVDFYTVEARPKNAKVFEQTGYKRRILTISKQGFMPVKATYFDRYNRLLKILTRHHFKNYGGDTWLPDMMLMDNIRENHKTLLKTRQRVFSADYVPVRMFKTDWLFANRHMASTIEHVFENTLTPRGHPVQSKHSEPAALDAQGSPVQ